MVYKEGEAYSARLTKPVVNRKDLYRSTYRDEHEE